MLRSVRAFALFAGVARTAIDFKGRLPQPLTFAGIKCNYMNPFICLVYDRPPDAHFLHKGGWKFTSLMGGLL
jgi:hypothetical protein